MKEILRTFFAAGLGSLIGALVCVVINPERWWLGMSVGFIAGYLATDFKEIIRAIPVAARNAKKGATEGWEMLGAWNASPQPFFYLPLLIATMVGTVLFYLGALNPKPSDPNGTTLLMVTVLITVILFLAISFGILPTAASIGLRVLKISSTEIDPHRLPSDSPEEKAEMARWERKAITYPRLFWWAVVGAGFFLAVMAAGVFDLIIKSFVYPAKFGWWLYKLIHSGKRLCLGFDSAFGVGIAWLCLVGESSMPMDTLGFLASGFLAGGMFGILNWEFIAKRLLKQSAIPAPAAL